MKMEIQCYALYCITQKLMCDNLRMFRGKMIRL